MTIPSKVYDVIKYILCIAIPAVNVAILALCAVFGWTWGETVTQCLIIFQTLMAALFCISIAGYKAEVVVVDETAQITEKANAVVVEEPVAEVKTTTKKTTKKATKTTEEN